jgi:cation-transporting P-type ATPase E
MTTTAMTIPHGLTDQEAQARRAQGQGNPPAPPSGRTYLQIVRENVFTFVNNAIFLLGLSLVLVGRPVDALISVGIIMTNVVVSVVQEVRAKRLLDKIALLTRPTGTVVRDGQERSVAPEELVIGDALRLAAGDQVLLDGMVTHGKMQVDESQLTGESDLVTKQPGDRVYSGSFCASGSGYYDVEKVGEASFANQVSAGARQYRRVLTPLQREINLAIRVILAIVVYLEVLIAASGLIKAIPLAQGVQQATVIVGLVPNGLFVAIAVAYALGAVRIAAKGALVQQANAVESLSNVDVLCLDKTGTLTCNRLQVTELLPLCMSEDELKTGLGSLAASATSHNKTGEAVVQAFPGERAPLAAEVPFSSARKWSAVAFDPPGRDGSDDGRPTGILALGAPEMLQPYLDAAGQEECQEWGTIAGHVQDWSSRGLRVLLLAHHPDAGLLREDGDASELPHDMAAAGLIGLADELRPEAQATLESFMRNGVMPKIISGDSPETVAALARQAGLDGQQTLYSGPDLSAMSEGEFAEAASAGAIFGRITPQQKERLIDSLRSRGHYVAMIGDGVNDVLSLKKANLGVAMQSGTQATRSVADIVLLDDSFASLAPAVAEGQRIINGMQDILKLYLTRITTMAVIIMSSLVIGVFPFNLRHASLLTLLSVGIPTVLLAVWARPGRRVAQPTTPQRLAHFVIPAAMVSGVLGLIVFYAPLLYRLSLAGTQETAEAGQRLALMGQVVATGQTTLTCFLVAVGLLLIVFVEPPYRWWVGADAYSGDRRPLLLALGLAAVFVIVMAVPGLAASFELAPLNPADIALVLAAALIWLIVARWVWRRKILERYFVIA